MWRKKKRSSPSREDEPADPSHGTVDGGTVTRVGFQARPGSERVNVYLDGAYAFSLAADLGLALREGQRLDADTVGDLRARDAAEIAYQRALRFLAPRPRSTGEVRRRLREHGYETAIVQAVIERLERQQLLDDQVFGEYWVSQRQTFRPRGPRALRVELRQKGLDAETAEAAIRTAPVGQEEAAYRAGAKRAHGLAGCDAAAFTQAMTGFLLRRGFDYQVVRVVVGQLHAEVHPPPQPSPVSGEGAIPSPSTGEGGGVALLQQKGPGP